MKTRDGSSECHEKMHPSADLLFLSHLPSVVFLDFPMFQHKGLGDEDCELKSELLFFFVHHSQTTLETQE